MRKMTRRRSPFFLLGSAALAAGIGGCGGGGSSGATPGASLAFAVKWQQKPAAAPSAAESTQEFPAPIPAAVNAIRFTYSSGGNTCCVAVLRGSQAFEERHLQLADVPEGPGILTVNGYPTDFAPSDGIDDTCPTRTGDGTACVDKDAGPSFASGDVEVDVQPATVNQVDVDVHSVPFFLNVRPADGETVTDARPTIRFTVVDAVFGINADTPAIITLEQGDTSLEAKILEAQPCRDNDAELPDCSEGGALDVSGFIIRARPTSDLQDGAVELQISSDNTAPEPIIGSFDSTFTVNSGITTTTVTTTTVTTTSITVTTSNTITTTTLTGVETFCLRFSVTNQVDLVGISYNVGYGATGGSFEGSGENVECQSVLDTNPESTLSTFNDDDGAETLSSAIISAETFSGPTPLAECRFQQVPPLDTGDFSIQVTEATGPDLNSVNATVGVEEIPCPQ
jgi:hypothetical protein